MIPPEVMVRAMNGVAIGLAHGLLRVLRVDVVVVHGDVHWIDEDPLRPGEPVGANGEALLVEDRRPGSLVLDRGEDFLPLLDSRLGLSWNGHGVGLHRSGLPFLVALLPPFTPAR